MTRRFMPVVILILLAGSAPAVAKDGRGTDIVLGDCLVLKPVGRYGRAALHLDALEAAIVYGRWVTAKAGEKVKAAAGGEQTWEAATAKDGALDHAALAGGYLHWRVDVDEECARILEASGHLMVYVNGEPRAGDPYQNGFVRLPVRLLKGPNYFLFHCSRGHLQAKLKDEGGSANLDARDATLPDFRAGEEVQPWAAVVVMNSSAKALKHY